MSIAVNKQITKEEIAALLDAGLTKKEAAKRLDICVATLSKIYGCEPRLRRPADEIDKIISEFEADADIKLLAKKYNTSPKNLRQLIYRRVGSTATYKRCKNIEQAVKCDPPVTDGDTIAIEKVEIPKEKHEISGTASAYLKYIDVDILAGEFTTYIVDYESRSVHIEVDGRKIYLCDFKTLSLVSRELMAIAQIINTKG